MVASYRLAPMARLEVHPFSAEFVEDAGRLLAARHRAHRAPSPCSRRSTRIRRPQPPRWRRWRRGTTPRARSALRGDRVVGFLLGSRRDETIWGPNVWVELAGHAVEEAEDLRDLYAAAAARWFDEGRIRHYALVPASDVAAGRRLVPPLVRAAARVRHSRGARRRLAGRGAAGGAARRRRARCARRRSSATIRRASPVFARGLPGRRSGRAARRDPRGPRQGGDRRARVRARRDDRRRLRVDAGRDVERPRRPGEATRCGAARVGRDAPWRPRLGSRARAHRRHVRVGAGARSRDDRHRLAGDEPALVALLAARAGSGRRSFACTAPSRSARRDALGLSGVRAHGARRCAPAPAAAATGGDRRRRRGRAGLAALPPVRPAARGARDAWRDGDARRRAAGAAAAGCAGRSPSGGARGHDRGARAPGDPLAAADAARRRRARAAGREPRARGPARADGRACVPRPGGGARRRVRRARLDRGGGPHGAPREPASRRRRSRGDRDGRRDRAPRRRRQRSSAPPERTSCAARARTRCSRQRPRAAGRSRSPSSGRSRAERP